MIQLLQNLLNGNHHPGSASKAGPSASQGETPVTPFSVPDEGGVATSDGETEGMASFGQSQTREHKHPEDSGQQQALANSAEPVMEQQRAESEDEASAEATAGTTTTAAIVVQSVLTSMFGRTQGVQHPTAHTSKGETEQTERPLLETDKAWMSETAKGVVAKQAEIVDPHARMGDGSTAERPPRIATEKPLSMHIHQPPTIHDKFAPGSEIKGKPILVKETLVQEESIELKSANRPVQIVSAKDAVSKGGAHPNTAKPEPQTLNIEHSTSNPLQYMSGLSNKGINPVSPVPAKTANDVTPVVLPEPTPDSRATHHSIVAGDSDEKGLKTTELRPAQWIEPNKQPASSQVNLKTIAQPDKSLAPPAQGNDLANKPHKIESLVSSVPPSDTKSKPVMVEQASPESQAKLEKGVAQQLELQPTLNKRAAQPEQRVRPEPVLSTPQVTVTADTKRDLPQDKLPQPLLDNHVKTGLVDKEHALTKAKEAEPGVAQERNKPTVQPERTVTPAPGLGQAKLSEQQKNNAQPPVQPMKAMATREGPHDNMQQVDEPKSQKSEKPSRGRAAPVSVREGETVAPAQSAEVQQPRPVASFDKINNKFLTPGREMLDDHVQAVGTGDANHKGKMNETKTESVLPTVNLKSGTTQAREGGAPMGTAQAGSATSDHRSGTSSSGEGGHSKGQASDHHSNQNHQAHQTMKGLSAVSPASHMQQAFSEPSAYTSLQANVIPAILQQIDRFRKLDKHNLRLKLELPGGERLTLQLRLDSDRVKVRFQTESDDMRDFLNDGWAGLANQASKQGIQLSIPEFTEDLGEDTADTQIMTQEQIKQLV